MRARTHVSWKQHVGCEVAQGLANQTKVLADASAVAGLSTQSMQQVVQLGFADATAAANPHIPQQKD